MNESLSEAKTLISGFQGASQYDDAEINACQEVLAAKSPYRYYGSRLLDASSRFEDQLAKRLKLPNVLALSSGTAALHVALAALEVGPGDEVVLPAYAWSADLMAILAIGAKPVIAPLDEKLCLRTDALEECFTEKTKAVIAVHMRGTIANTPEIHKQTQSHGVFLVEDGSQAFGADGIGSFGDVSTFSFQLHKLISSGEGGAIACRSEEVFERARAFHDLGMNRVPGDPDPVGLESISTFGLNYRITELQSAILGVQLKKLETIRSRLNQNSKRLRDLLSDWMRTFELEFVETPGNHAYLAIRASQPRQLEAAANELGSNGIPFIFANRLDPHHHRVWENFLGRKSYPHQSRVDEKTKQLLATTLYLEVGSGEIT